MRTFLVVDRGGVGGIMYVSIIHTLYTYAMPTARITTTIDPLLLLFADQQAKAGNVTRRAVIEAALRQKQLEIERVERIAAYNEFAASEEMEEWVHIANNPANLTDGLGHLPWEEPSVETKKHAKVRHRSR